MHANWWWRAIWANVCVNIHKYMYIWLIRACTHFVQVHQEFHPLYKEIPEIVFVLFLSFTKDNWRWNATLSHLTHHNIFLQVHILSYIYIKCNPAVGNNCTICNQNNQSLKCFVCTIYVLRILKNNAVQFYWIDFYYSAMEFLSRHSAFY